MIRKAGPQEPIGQPEIGQQEIGQPEIGYVPQKHPTRRNHGRIDGRNQSSTPEIQHPELDPAGTRRPDRFRFPRQARNHV